MLVLSRKINQQIKIGDDILITVVAISGDTVRIGIEAPRNIQVLRNEIFQEIKQQNNDSVVYSNRINSIEEIRKSILINIETD
jgi:carbon storage regulator